MFEYRSFMIDSARHMQEPEDIKLIIDAMAKLGFNTFHWHLTEDQGWRFESEKYPVLNEKSAVREFSNFGKTHFDEPYGRVYNKDEMRDIVAYCSKRNIEVVPEFDMPGHTGALLASFPNLACREKDFKVKTHQGIFSDVLCPAKEEVYSVIFDLIDEFCEIFPGRYFHIGGDETPSRQWEDCPKCRALKYNLGLESWAEYQNHFMNRVIDYLESKGKHAIVWNDAAKGKNLDRRAVLQYWKEKDRPSIEFINGGGKAILSPFTYYYFDYDYSITPLNRTYSFNPRLRGLTDEGYGNIIGLEAPIWTEYIWDAEVMQKMLFPRIIAVSQTMKGEDKMPYREFVKYAKEKQKELGVAFEDEKEWTKPRIASVFGWSRFVKEHYTKEYINAAKNHEF